MRKIKYLSCICGFLSLACSFNRVPERNWEITYRRVDYFFGSILIKIGSDSCYYESAAGIYKNPPVIKWKSRRKKLDELYRQVEKLRLQDCLPLMAIVTEEPVETLELVQNDKVVFSVQKDIQPTDGVKKFEMAIALLKSFASSENGWTY